MLLTRPQQVIRFSATMLIVVGFCLPVFGQDESQSATEAPDATAIAGGSDDSAVHDEIRTLRDGLIAAINDSDIDALIPLLHVDVILTAQAGSELKTVRGHDAIRNYMEQLLTGEDSGVVELKLNPTVDELTILHGDDTGVAYGKSDDHYVLRNGNEFDLPTRWSSTIVKDGEQWKVASLHVSSNLFDNPVMSAQGRILKIVAAVLGIIGLIVGFLLGRRRKTA